RVQCRLSFRPAPWCRAERRGRGWTPARRGDRHAAARDPAARSRRPLQLPSTRPCQRQPRRFATRMRKSVPPFGLALLLAAPGAVHAQADVQGPEGSPVARHGALAVKDGKIVGEDGEPVTLRGMSLFWSQWEPEYYSAETVDWLVEDWKITAIRAAIAAEGDDSARQHFDREFAKASAVIDAAVRSGIYVLVDWHAHRSYPEEAERFLTAIARKYGHLPNLIYEPFNEPLREGVDWSRDVKPYHQRVVGAIRAIDPDNLVV